MNTDFTPSNVDLWICNFKRPLELITTIRGWLSSFDFQVVNVLSNHSTLQDNSELPVDIKDKVKVWYHWDREDFECGSLSENWNIAVKKAYIKHDWVILSQDDLIINPGWPDKIINSNYKYYLAPAGDVCQIQHIDSFSKLGWRDEIWRAPGGSEQDYLIRALNICPEEISVHDEHIWQLRHNDVGLADHFSSNHTPAALETRKHNVELSQDECFAVFSEKYGKDIDGLMCRQEYKTPYMPGFRDRDWHPSWTRYMKQIGRYK